MPPFCLSFIDRSRTVQGLLTILFALLVQHYFSGTPAERHTPAMSYTSPEYIRVGPRSPFGYQLFHFTDYLVPRPGHQPYLRWVQDSHGVGVELVPWGAEGGREDIHESIVPVLFVHGNSGHYSEGRGLGGAIARAQESKRKSKPKSFSSNLKGPHRVEMFTIDFREEANIHSAETVLRQAVFVNESIAFLQALFPKTTEQQGVWIVAHSMGGVISRLLPLVRAFGAPFRMSSTETFDQIIAEAELGLPSLSKVTKQKDLIPPPPIAGLILLASPQVAPPVIMDADIALLYESIRHSWGEGFSAWAGFNSSVGIRDLVCLPNRPVPLTTMEEWRGWGSAVDGNTAESREHCESSGGALFPIRWYTEGLPVLSFAGGPLDFMIHNRLTWTEHGAFHRAVEMGSEELEKLASSFHSGDLSVRDVVAVSRPLSHQSITWGLPWLHCLGELIVTLALQVPNDSRSHSRSQSNPNPNPNPVGSPKEASKDEKPVQGPTFSEERWVDSLLPNLGTAMGATPRWLRNPTKFRTVPLPSYSRTRQWVQRQVASTPSTHETANNAATLVRDRVLILSIGAAHRWGPEVSEGLEGQQEELVTHPVLPGVGMHGLGPKFDPLPETVHHVQRVDGTVGTVTAIKSFSIVDLHRTKREGKRYRTGLYLTSSLLSSATTQSDDGKDSTLQNATNEVRVQIRLPREDQYNPTTVALPLREWRYDSASLTDSTSGPGQRYSSAGPNCGLGFRAAPCAIRGQAVYSVVIAPVTTDNTVEGGGDEPHWFPLVVARCGWSAPNSKGDQRIFVDERILFPPHDGSKLSQPVSMAYKVHPPQDWFSATANLRKEQSLFQWDLPQFFTDLVGLPFLSSQGSRQRQHKQLSLDPEWCSFTLIGDGSLYDIQVLAEPFYVQWIHRMVDGLRYPLVVIMAILSFLLPFPYWLLRNASWCLKAHLQIKKSGRGAAGKNLLHKPSSLAHTYAAEGSETSSLQNDPMTDPPSPLLRHVQRFPSLAAPAVEANGVGKEVDGVSGQGPRAPSSGSPVDGGPSPTMGPRHPTPPPPLTASILFTQPLSYLHSMFHWQAKVKLYLGLCILSTVYLTLRRGAEQLPASASAILLPYSLEEIVALSLGALCLHFVAMNIDEALVKGLGIGFQLLNRASHKNSSSVGSTASVTPKPDRRRNRPLTKAEWFLGIYLFGFALFRSEWFLPRRLSVEEWINGYVRKSLKDPLSLACLLFKVFCSEYDGAENVFHNLVLNIIILVILSRTLVLCRLRAAQLTEPWRVPGGITTTNIPTVAPASISIQRLLRPNSRHLDILGRLWFYQIIGYMYFLTLPFVFSMKNAIMAPAAVPAAGGESLGTLLLIGLTCYVYRLSQRLEEQLSVVDGRSRVNSSSSSQGQEDSDGGSDVNVALGSAQPSGVAGGLRHRRVGAPSTGLASGSSSITAPDSDLRSNTGSDRGVDPNTNPNVLLPAPIAILRAIFCIAYFVIILSMVDKGFLAPLSVYHTRAGIQLLMSAVLLQEFLETVLSRYFVA
jgi:hypothetical protein